MIRVPASTVHGFPRIGPNRELKKATEGFWQGRVSSDQLAATGRQIRTDNWARMVGAGIELPPSNDFSFYDQMLDMAVLVDAVPARYRSGLRDTTDQYFAMARGVQAEGVDLAALQLTKWFDTNYHYLVPELSPSTAFTLAGSKPLDEFDEAAALGITTKPVLIGPVTFLALSKPGPDKKLFDRWELLPALLEVYSELLRRLGERGAPWVQLDEPALVEDRTASELEATRVAYRHLAAISGRPAVCVSTYFDHAAGALDALLDTPIEGIGLDFCAGSHNQRVVEDAGSLDGRVLFAGVVDGRSVWANRLGPSLTLLERLTELAGPVVVSTSCSLQHVPVDLGVETNIDREVRQCLAFAQEKLTEVAVLARGLNEGRAAISTELDENAERFERRARSTRTVNPEVRTRIDQLDPSAFARPTPYLQRRKLQQDRLHLQPFPTTTIGSFPQTRELRAARSALGRGEITVESYELQIGAEIEAIVSFQERLGIDVIVHGEPERNDMVQYFAEQLDGFAVTEHGWVQSFGTRCIRPPVIIGDISRPEPITVRWATYASQLTDRPVKGMLTGPVTMLLWSFRRDDLAPADQCRQIAVAVRDEVDDLQAAGMAIIQVDEPALREGLPLRNERRARYLHWAAECFRLATAVAHDDTQIHTHMCYSEFGSILPALTNLDADVVSFEAARSRMELLDELQAAEFDRDVGPGVYDIHSPRVPATQELVDLLERAIAVVEPEHLWVNPDCGLKTRGYAETEQALEHLVAAADQLRRQSAR